MAIYVLWPHMYYTHRHTSERNGEQGHLLTCEIPWLSCPRRQRQPLHGEDRCHRRSMVQHGAGWCSWSVEINSCTTNIYDDLWFIHVYLRLWIYERLSMIVYDYICMMIYDYLWLSMIIYDAPGYDMISTSMINISEPNLSIYDDYLEHTHI